MALDLHRMTYTNQESIYCPISPDRATREIMVSQPGLNTDKTTGATAHRPPGLPHQRPYKIKPTYKATQPKFCVNKSMKNSRNDPVFGMLIASINSQMYVVMPSKSLFCARREINPLAILPPMTCASN